MATIEEGRFCQVDSDCSEKQYCYHVSGQCVDYTQCNRYNRKEARKRSRHPSQCGPCFPGYTSEILGTGEMALVCKKVNVHENVTEAEKLNSVMIIWLTIGVLSCCLMAMVFGIFLKKRSSSRRDNNRTQWDDLCVAEPSAPPPPETSPFIGYRDRSAHSPSNNNQNLKDKNKLVMATPFKEPSWIRTNPNYEHNLSNDNLNIVEQSHGTVQLPLTDTNSNNWPSEQLAIQVTDGTTTEYDVEQIDNSMNAVLVQRSNPSGSNTGANNNNSNNNNNNGSASGSSDAQGNGERIRASNILITQKISMNVNVLNGDC